MDDTIALPAHLSAGALAPGSVPWRNIDEP
jgi:hypothetical protein